MLTIRRRRGRRSTRERPRLFSNARFYLDLGRYDHKRQPGIGNQTLKIEGLNVVCGQCLLLADDDHVDFRLFQIGFDPVGRKTDFSEELTGEAFEMYFPEFRELLLCLFFELGP